MKLSNLKASLLAVVFALGVNTTVQAAELAQHLPGYKTGGTSSGSVYHGSTAQSHHTDCDDDMFYSSHPTHRTDSKRAGREEVVKREFIEIKETVRPAPKPQSSGEVLSLEEIITAYGKQFHSCEEWMQIDAQNKLLGFLKSGKEKAVLLSANELSKIIVETNKPHPVPAPKPQPITVKDVLTGDYTLSIDTCQLGNMVKRIEGKTSKASALSMIFETINQSGIKFSITATGKFSLTDDPCKPACANLCGTDKTDCGCQQESQKAHDDCKCHDKGRSVSKADIETIDLLIQYTAPYSHCDDSAKTILGPVFPYASPVQQAKIQKMLSGSC